MEPKVVGKPTSENKWRYQGPSWILIPEVIERRHALGTMCHCRNKKRPRQQIDRETSYRTGQIHSPNYSEKYLVYVSPTHSPVPTNF